jgi:predicted tellurium resistance membrane protein TerC
VTLKTIIIIALLFIGFHLLLYGFMKRRIAAAKRTAEQEND